MFSHHQVIPYNPRQQYPIAIHKKCDMVRDHPYRMALRDENKSMPISKSLSDNNWLVQLGKA